MQGLQQVHSLVLTHDPSEGQPSLFCGLTCQKGGRKFDLGKGKARPWDPASGAYRLVVSLWSGMGCAMSGDLALSRCLLADNNLGEDKL